MRTLNTARSHPNGLGQPGGNPTRYQTVQEPNIYHIYIDISIVDLWRWSGFEEWWSGSSQAISSRWQGNDSNWLIMMMILSQSYRKLFYGETTNVTTITHPSRSGSFRLASAACCSSFVPEDIRELEKPGIVNRRHRRISLYSAHSGHHKSTEHLHNDYYLQDAV